MTPEIIAIVTVGVALAGVILTSARGVRQDINELRGEVGTHTRYTDCHSSTSAGAVAAPRLAPARSSPYASLKPR